MINCYIPRPCRIVSVRRETDSEYTFTLESDIRPQHGQFVEVSLPGVGEAPISVSGFSDGWIELTIRATGTLTRRIVTRVVGDVLFVRGPYGTPFPADYLAERFVVVAAGGCAVAPVRTFIRSRLARPTLAAATRLIFGFKNPESVMYREEIEEWKRQVPVIVTVDSETCTWNGKTGLITRHIPSIDIPEPAHSCAVVVGPPDMMKFTAQEFIKRGIAPDRIWVSMERRMACGLGKCGHCKINNTYVCVDGPVLRYDTACDLVD